MDEIEKIFQANERQYKKITQKSILLYIVVLLLLILCFYDEILNNDFSSIVLFLLSMFFWYSAWKNIRSAKYAQNNILSLKKLSDDMDVKCPLKVFERLLENKKRKDYSLVLFNYLSLLVTVCKFDEFRNTYECNRTVIKKSPIMLEYFREIFAGLMKDDSVYNNIILEHEFSRYFHAQGELTPRGERQRSKDKQREISQLLIKKDYQTVIKRIDQIEKVSKFAEFSYSLLKEEALFWLAPNNYQLPEIEYPEFLCAQSLIHLVETGERYYYEYADEIYDMIDLDMKNAKRKLI